jgi:hypothetical protein
VCYVSYVCSFFPAASMYIMCAASMYIMCAIIFLAASMYFNVCSFFPASFFVAADAVLQSSNR